MADTRCANPEYQLDVDVMILEHLLYHAVRAQFDALRAESEKQDLGNAHEQSLETSSGSANHLLYAFDCECVAESQGLPWCTG